MSYFDLLFLASVLLSIAALITAAIYALRGRGRRALSIVKWWGIYVAAYMMIGTGSRLHSAAAHDESRRVMVL